MGLDEARRYLSSDQRRSYGINRERASRRAVVRRSAFALHARNSSTYNEFEARIEAVEARMDARMREIGARLDAFTARAEEREQRFIERLNERDKRIELLAHRADVAAESAANLKAHLWMAASTVVLAIAGTLIAACYATQSSHFDLAQTIISAFQQGQQTPLAD